MPIVDKKRNSKGQFVRNFYISKGKVLKLYNKKNLTTRDFCDLLSISYTQIYNLFKKYHIKLIGKKRFITYCCKLCGNRISSTSALQGNGTCNFCANSKENNPRYIDGRTKNARYYCKVCSKLISIYSATYGKGQCSSCSHKGKKSYLFGKPPIPPRRYKYNKIWMRSTWEAKFAQWCDLSGIAWEYEPKAFELVVNKKETTYTPDFYLPEFDCYIEIKGWFRNNSKKKFNSFKKKYINTNIKIFYYKDLRNIGVL